MSIYVMARKAKMKKKEREYNAVNPFYLNMTHTGRLITPCNENGPTPAPQSCYGQYLKKRVREYVESNVNVTHKRMPDFTASQYTANKTSRAIQDEKCCPTQPPICYNNCKGGLKGLPTVTKDLGFKPSSFQTAKKKADRICMCNPGVGTNNYETPIFGNRAYKCI